MAAKFQPIWWLKFGQFGGRISAHLAAEFRPICWPNLDQFRGRILANLLDQFGGRSSSFLFRPLLVLFSTLFSALFSDIQNRLSFGLPYRNENVPEIPDRYFRVWGPIFAKIHRISKMLPERIALLPTYRATLH